MASVARTQELQRLFKGIISATFPSSSPICPAKQFMPAGSISSVRRGQQTLPIRDRLGSSANHHAATFHSYSRCGACRWLGIGIDRSGRQNTASTRRVTRERPCGRGPWLRASSPVRRQRKTSNPSRSRSSVGSTRPMGPKMISTLRKQLIFGLEAPQQ